MVVNGFTAESLNVPLPLDRVIDNAEAPYFKATDLFPIYGLVDYMRRNTRAIRETPNLELKMAHMDVAKAKSQIIGLYNLVLGLELSALFH